MVFIGLAGKNFSARYSTSLQLKISAVACNIICQKAKNLHINRDFIT